MSLNQTKLKKQQEDKSSRRWKWYVILSSADSCRNIHIYILDTYRRDDKDAVINDAPRKTQWQRQTQEDFFIKYFTSHFIWKVSKRVTQSLCVRGSWRPNITEIFWPQSYGRQRCVFLVLNGCSTGALESNLLGAGFPYYITSISLSNYTACPQLYSNCLQLFSIRRPYITFKLQCGDMDTPPQLLPISSDRNVSLPLTLECPVWSSSSGNNCHAVQRSLSSGASVYESIMGLFFLPRPISSATFRPRDFLSQLPLECVTSFRCLTLNGIFGLVKRSKHNKNSKRHLLGRFILTTTLCYSNNVTQLYT